jgi:acetylornithine deacetylase
MSILPLVIVWYALISQGDGKCTDGSRVSAQATGTRDEHPDEGDLRGLTYPSDVQSIAEELISIPSPSGSEHEAGRYIEQWLTTRGWNVSLQFIADDAQNRFNVVGLIGDVSLVDVDVILSTHFDTVPITVHNPRTSATRLYGRGAVDTKGIIAAMLVAAETLRLSAVRTVGLLFLCGERQTTRV